VTGPGNAGNHVENIAIRSARPVRGGGGSPTRPEEVAKKRLFGLRSSGGGRLVLLAIRQGKTNPEDKAFQEVGKSP